jgi:folate-binding protein YgfZ
MAQETILYEQTKAAGAVYVEEAGFLVPGHFGDALVEYRAAREAVVVVDESARGKIEVRGVDSARFLHNLTTNDILGLQPGKGCEAFLTTAKAKVISYLLIYRNVRPVDPPSFSLDVAPGHADRVIQYLDRFLISEQVEFANDTAGFAQLHLAGPQAGDLLQKILGEVELPHEPLHHVGLLDSPFGEKSWLRRHDALGVPGFDIICSANRAASVWQQILGAGARPAGHEACEMLRIEAGLPCQDADIDENTFAPEVGRIDETICYTKGCYLGQESIVMARDRGQVNRTLVGVKLPNGPVPRGSLLFVEEKEVGRVTSSIRSPRLAMGLGLAYVRRGHQQTGTKLHVETEAGRVEAEVVALPLA